MEVMLVGARPNSPPRAQRIVTSRRGQLLGFDTKAGLEGWDEVTRP